MPRLMAVGAFFLYRKGADVDSVRAIHDTPWRGVLAVTGGGGALLAELLAVPGASRTVLEAVVPYSPAALEAFLNAAPQQACAEETARKMAVTAWQRAQVLAGEDTQLFGFAVTASLATDRPHRGEHRVFMAFHCPHQTLSLEMPLEKGVRTRREEETLVAEAGLGLLAYATGAGQRDALPAEAVLHEFHPPASWRELFHGKREAVCIRLPEMEEISPAPEVAAVLSGSFAPFHQGHARMRDFARNFLGADVALELAIRNADKPALDYPEIHRRLEQISQTLRQAGEQTLIFLTNFPYFRQKAAFFRGATFIVGADTISRIADPAYHGGDPEALRRSLVFLKSRGCRFLVLGRICDACFRTLEDLAMPETLREICVEISETDFREDISSTELRRRAEK